MPREDLPGSQEDGSANDSNHLSDQDRTLALLLAQGYTHVEAADKLGLSSKTVQRRKGNPAFTAAVAREQANIYEEMRGLLLRHSRHAANVLIGLLDADEPKFQLQSARTYLALVSKLGTSDSLAMEAPPPVEH